MRCGFFESEITPPLGASMYGYGVTRLASGLRSRLYAKAAVLETEDGLVAMLAVDAEKLPVGIIKTVRERVSRYTPILPENILLAATHSHTSGPVYANGGLYKGINVKGNELIADDKLDDLTLRITAMKAADAIILAWQRLRPAVVQFGSENAEGISFVRQYILRDGSVRTNPKRADIERPYANPDTHLPVLFFTTPEGDPLGAITSFALHHDTDTDKKSDSDISADYSGYVSRELRRHFGEDFVTVFFSGFCGNINHFNYGGTVFAMPSKEIGGAVSQKLLAAIHSAEPMHGPVCSLRETVPIPKRRLEPGFLDRVKYLLKNPPSEGQAVNIANPDSDLFKYSRGPAIVEFFDTDNRELYLDVQVIRVGDCLICAVPWEIFSQFGEKIRNELHTDKIILVSMANEDATQGYIPTPELFLPTVYESSVASAKLDPSAGDMLADTVISLGRQLA